ncbi:hypothetical protein ABBQ38_013023 [Trebouxia sp. C0009 RCD-2024]
MLLDCLEELEGLSPTTLQNLTPALLVWSRPLSLGDNVCFLMQTVQGESKTQAKKICRLAAKAAAQADIQAHGTWQPVQLNKPTTTRRSLPRQRPPPLPRDTLQ